MANRTKTYNEAVRANLPSGMIWDGRRYVYNNHKFTSYNRAIWYYNYLQRTGGDFTPADLYEGGKLGFYYDAANAAVSVGSPVDTLPDGSGNGLTISNSNSDGRPTLSNNATLGANYMAFDGIDDRLQSALNVNFTSASGFTMYALITPRDVVNRGRLYTLGAAYLELPRNSTNIMRQTIPGQNTNVPSSAIPVSWLDQVSCVVITHELATDQLEFRVNGSALAVSRTPNPGGSYSNDPFALCARPDFAPSIDYGKIDVYEFGIVEGVASAEDIANIETYLMDKGGIT